MTVAEFYERYVDDGRAVLSYSRYRDRHVEPWAWLARPVNRLGAMSYWICYHSESEIRRVDPGADVSSLGVAINVFQKVG